MASVETQGLSVEKLRELFEETIRDGRLKLPVLPDLGTRVREAATQASSNANDLAAIIEVDPGLAARILKMANSAMYAGLSEIRSLPQAIGRLGAGMVVAVVIGSAGKEIFKTECSDFRLAMLKAWRRSVFGAATAQLLGSRIDLSPEEGFIAGLLHTVGEPILLDAALQFQAGGKTGPISIALFTESAKPLMPTAGAALLEKWNLPRVMVEAVRHQHAPDAAPEDARSSAAMIHLTDRIASSLAVAGRLEEISAIAASPAALALRLDEAQIETLAAEALEAGRIVADSL